MAVCLGTKATHVLVYFTTLYLSAQVSRFYQSTWQLNANRDVMAEQAEVIRELIARENDMINQRITWFLVLQGFMLAGLAFGWEKSAALCTVFAVLGILTSISVGILLRYGILAIAGLEASCQDTEEMVIGRGSKETPALIHLLLPWHLLPIAFTASWIALVVIRLQHAT